MNNLLDGTDAVPAWSGGAAALVARLRRSRLALAVGAVVGLLALLYAAVVEPRRLRPLSYTLLVPGLPPGLAGVRVAHLTDFHVGMRGTPLSVLRRAAAQARAWRPDLVLLTGDFVHNGRWLPEADLFGELAAEAPCFAVLGNHDSWSSRRETDGVVAALEAAGVAVLRNAAATVALPGRGELVLVGVEDPSLQRDDLDKAMAGLPDEAEPARPTILLAHAPEMADRVPEGRFALIVSGHTHGGQIHMSPVRHVTILEFGMLAGGLMSTYARGTWVVRGNPLYVNSGLGVSGLPLRFMAPPEVALFVLQPAPEGVVPESGPFIRA